MAHYRPGESGNPSGRPPGIGRTVELRRMLFSQSEEIIQAVIDRALLGDPTAMKLVVERMLPALRPADMPVSIPRADDGNVETQANYVLTALLSGGLAPDLALRVMQALQIHYSLTELQDLEARITALESGNGNTASTSDPAE